MFVTELEMTFLSIAVLIMAILLSAFPQVQLAQLYCPSVLFLSMVLVYSVYRLFRVLSKKLEVLSMSFQKVLYALEFSAAKLAYIESRADSGNPRPQDILRHLVQGFSDFDEHKGGAHIFLEQFVSQKAALFSAAWAKSFNAMELAAEFNQFLEAAQISAREAVFYQRSKWQGADEHIVEGWIATLANTLRPELNTIMYRPEQIRVSHLSFSAPFLAEARAKFENLKQRHLRAGDWDQLSQMPPQPQLLRPFVYAE